MKKNKTDGVRSLRLALTIATLILFAGAADARALATFGNDGDDRISWAFSDAFASGAPTPIADLEARCGDSIAVLARGRGVAAMQFQNWEIGAARRTMDASFAQARAVAPIRSFTRILIARGLVMSRKIGADDGGTRDRVALKVLTDLVDLIEATYRELEIPYYFHPCYASRYASCSGWSTRFDDQFWTLARRFLRFVVTHSELLAIDEIELALSALTASWVSDDLNHSLNRRRFACTIRELADLSELAQHPTASPWQALQYIRARFSHIADGITCP